jgi:hypothetical protein
MIMRVALAINRSMGIRRHCDLGCERSNGNNQSQQR